jgi:hypothetical protein
MKKAVSIPKLKKKAQLIFNEYIRLRDKDLPCISCDLPKETKQAGHYYPTQGYDGLRFDAVNCNGECAGCNCFDESHLIGYGENLLDRVGQVEFDLLKLRAKDYKMHGHKWSRSELVEIIRFYTEKVNGTLK